MILFDHVCGVVEAVYVPIAGCDTVDKVARFCRSVFVLADDVVRERKPGEDISTDLLCRRLKAKEIEYFRNGSSSVGEWLIALFSFAKKHGGTITSVVLKAIKLG